MKNKTSQSGFTLIELIAVMVILGILAAVIIPRITTITSGAYESNVRNMFGLIKNEVTAQAIKAAMSGDYLETYPEPGEDCDGCPTEAVMRAEHYYLERWVGDYDPAEWSSFVFADKYANSSFGSKGAVNAALFMYHPHGRPAEISWSAGTSFESTPGGTAVNKEDIYWIYYAPRTSSAGEDKGRELDGYVMGAWKNEELGYDFDGVINPAGENPRVGTGDQPLTDMTIVYNPAY